MLSYIPERLLLPLIKCMLSTICMSVNFNIEDTLGKFKFLSTSKFAEKIMKTNTTAYLKCLNYDK